MARARRAVAAAERDRVARVGRHDLHRQDGHADRGRAAARRVAARRRGRPRPSSAPRSAGTPPLAEARNATLAALAERLPAAAAEPADEDGPVPLAAAVERPADRRRPLRPRRAGALPARRRSPSAPPLEQEAGRRVRRLRRRRAPPSRTTPTPAPPPLRPSGSRCSRRSSGPTPARRSPTSLEQGVEIVVLSGDAPATVGSIAARRRHPVRGPPLDGGELPADDAGLAGSPATRPWWVASRPEGKRRVVESLARATAATWRWSATASTTCPR